MPTFLVWASWALAASHCAAAFDIQAHRITELMAAVFTPMKDGGMEVDLDAIPAYARYMAGLNITNIMPCGSNGESLSLTVAERRSIAEAWAGAAAPLGLRIYVHIGSESVLDAVELARHAASTKGVSGILSMTPVYYKPTAETLLDFLAAVAGAAPELPLWFYHFPDATGVLPGQAHRLLQLAESTGRIPNLAGVKFTDYNFMDLQLCTQVGKGKYNVIFGRDEVALGALELGADAAVSSTCQFAPSLRVAVSAFRRGDIEAAKRAQEENARLCSMFARYESDAKDVQKDIMRMAGMDVGPARLPKRDLSAQEYSELQGLLRRQMLIDSPAGAPQLVV